MAKESEVDKMTAACKYIGDSLDGLQKLKKAVCDKDGDSVKEKEPVGPEKKPVGPEKEPVKDPAAAAAERKAAVEGFLDNIKKNNPARNTELGPLSVVQDDAAPYAIMIKGGKVDVPVADTDTEAEVKQNIEDMLAGDALTGGGRRGKRSARRSFRSSKGGRRSRKGKKGGRRSRGCKCSKSCKCRKCRGRTNKRR
jgi:hypothetical protein